MRSTSALIDRDRDWTRSADASNLSLRLAKWQISLRRIHHELEIRDADRRALVSLQALLEVLAGEFEFTQSSGRRGSRPTRFAGVDMPDLVETVDIRPDTDLADWLRRLHEDVSAVLAGDTMRVEQPESFVAGISRALAVADDRLPQATNG